MSLDGIDSVVGKRGLFMCRFKSLFLLRRAKGRISADAFDFNNIVTWAVIKFFPARQAPKEIHAILKETLEEHAPSYSTVKNLVAQFECRNFSTCIAPLPGPPKTVTTLKIIDQIHALILEDRRIAAKSLADQLGISRERIGSIIRDDFNMRKIFAKWVPKCAMVNGASRLSNFWNFFGYALSKWLPVAIPDHGWNLVISLWPEDKATMNGVAA